jgi:rare lipoprotein A
MGAITEGSLRNWGATMRLNKIRLVVCLGASAVSGLLANQALACGEQAWLDSDEMEIGAIEPATATEPATTTTLVSPPPVASTNSELSNQINPVPMRNIWAAPADATIVGTASFYDDPQQTASGEPYDPEAFTAAAQLKIRDKFGGIRFGRLYQPAYAVAEYENKKIIIKFNDVGPLRPGRKFDLSRAAMAYFDGLEKGLLPDLKVTPLPLGQIYVPGPVTDAQLFALGIDMGLGFTTAHAPIAQEPSIQDSRAIIAPQAAPVAEPALPAVGEIAVQPEVGES